MKLLAGLSLCVVLGACASGGGAPTATGSASLAPGATASASGATPTPRPELLFAVLEAHGDHANVPLQDDTIAVVGLDGVARAKATFTPRSRPFIGNAAAVLEPEAHVAAGAVFYVDGQGTVRRLHAGAPPATVTTFPFLTSQTEFSFAVSGDGTALAASGFTFPPQASTSPPHHPVARSPASVTRNALRAPLRRTISPRCWDGTHADG